MACIKLNLFLLRVRTNLRLVWHLDAYLQGILKHYSGQFILDLYIMGLYLLPSRVYKWTIYLRLTRGLCTVYILSPGYPWDIVLSMLNFWIFMGPVFNLQVHARKFCGQFTCLLIFIMLKSLLTFGAEVEDVWSYNFIFTYLLTCSMEQSPSWKANWFCS